MTLGEKKSTYSKIEFLRILEATNKDDELLVLQAQNKALTSRLDFTEDL